MKFILFVLSLASTHLLLAVKIYWTILCTTLPLRRKRIEGYAFETAERVLAALRRYFNFSIRIEGIEGIGKSSVDIPPHALIVANHQSLIDIYVNLFMFPGSGLRFVAKKALGRSIPGVSGVLSYGQHCLISRASQYRETHASLKAFAEQCAQQKLSPCIFPEGTRSRDGILKEFNSGGYRILQNTLMLPTVVVAVDGGWKLSHLVDFLQKKPYVYRARVLTVLPPPQNRHDIQLRLEKSQLLIKRQLSIWRSEDALHVKSL